LRIPARRAQLSLPGGVGKAHRTEERTMAIWDTLKKEFDK